MQKTTIRLDEDVVEAIQEKCNRHGDFQWLINEALRKAYCKQETSKKPRDQKSNLWRDFFALYPANKKGGTDRAAWTAAKREKLSDADFSAMIDDVKARSKNHDWLCRFAPGITKYISERVWLTPLPQNKTQQRQEQKKTWFEDGDVIDGQYTTEQARIF